MILEQILVLAGIIGGLFIILSIGVYFNRKIPVPEGCMVIGCDHCDDTGCGFNPGSVEQLKADIKREIEEYKVKEGVDSE